MRVANYYAKIYRLAFINRYTNVVRIRNEDVAQHSFFVAAIILKLHEEYDFDLGKALQAAISHDITEADLSDVTHDVKQRFPQLAEEISIAESSAIKEYPQAVQDGFSEFENPSSVAGMIANLADIMQVEQYIESEISLGNTNVGGIQDESRSRRYSLTRSLKSYVRT